MKRAIFSGVALGVLLFASAPARAGHIHGAAFQSSTCPQGVGVADGCASANPNSTFLVSTTYSPKTFYTYAATSGQTWTSAHPWNWNAAGVDYPVGWDSTLSYTPVGSASAGSGPGQIPSACVYSATAGPSGTPRLFCTGTLGVTYTLSQLDFGANNGVTLRLCGPGTAIVTNNKFKNGSNTDQINNQLLNVCTSATFPLTIGYNEFDGDHRDGHIGLYQAVFAADNNPLTIQYNWFHDLPNQVVEAAPLNASASLANNFIDGWNLLVPYTPATGLTMSYDTSTAQIVTTALTGALPPGTVLTGTGLPVGTNIVQPCTGVSPNLTCQINVKPTISQTNITTVTTSTSALHGAVMETTTTTNGTPFAPSLITAQLENFNTVVEPTGTPGILGTTAFSVLGNAANSYQGITNLEIGHNIIVFNCAATLTNCNIQGTNATVNAGITDIFGLQLVASANIHDNFLDPHGAEVCVQTLGMAQNLVGTIDNGAGGAGNTLTITSAATGKPYIYPYQFITGTGIPSSSTTTGYYVLPYGSTVDGNATTGQGLTRGGTYTYGIASATPGPIGPLTSDSTWKTASTAINPSTGLPLNPTFTGNVNMLAGYGDTAITQSGVQMNAGQCNGHTTP